MKVCFAIYKSFFNIIFQTLKLTGTHVIWTLMLIAMYLVIIAICYSLVVFSWKYFVHQFKSSFPKMGRRALWNATRDESFYSDVLSETDFTYSQKESENEGAECTFCKGKFSEDEREEIWIKCFSCSLWAHLTLPQQRTQSVSVTL